MMPSTSYRVTISLQTSTTCCRAFGLPGSRITVVLAFSRLDFGRSVNDISIGRIFASNLSVYGVLDVAYLNGLIHAWHSMPRA